MNLNARTQAIDFIRSWLEYKSRQMNVPGFVVAIQHKRELLLLEAYGKANVAHSEPMTTNHVFGIASQSKMFTATAVMQLAERGMLSLDDRVVHHLPELAHHPDPKFRAVTIKHLLRHGSGLLRDGHNSDFWQLQRPFPDASELRNEVLGVRLVDKPGGKLKYSNLGYALLGQTIQKVSGVSYNSYVMTNIMKPLGLSYTAPDYVPRLHEDMATGYTRTFDQKRYPVTKVVHTRAFAPLFGWHTNARDLCRFALAQLPGDNTLLSDEAKNQLHTGRRHHWSPPDQRGTEYGLGFINYQLGERRVVGHGGVSMGYRSCLYIDVANELSVVILANARDMLAIEMMQGIFSIFDYFEQWGTKSLPPERARLNARLMSFWGTIQIVATHNRVVMVLPEQWQPFAGAEEWELINPMTLKITKAPDLASEKELISLRFRYGKMASINYAGTTMVPEQEYLANLNQLVRSWSG